MSGRIRGVREAHAASMAERNITVADQRLDALLPVKEVARPEFPNGARFEVVRPGARLEGIVVFGEKAWSGYFRHLEVGEVLTCLGWATGMDGRTQEVNFTCPASPTNAQWLQLWPQASLWRPWPMDGYLEEVL